MFENAVRKALLDRRVTFGSWIQIRNATSSEILANAGFDWIAVDCEHTDIDVKGFTTLVRGMYGRGPIPFVRVRENDTLAIRQVLDAGAMGVIVPLVGTAAEARRAVQAAKYPPRGIRGFCFSRMNNFGLDFEEYVDKANDNVAVVVMIESKEAIENIDEILSVEGVDGVFVGPYDLSGSYGIPGKTDDPRVVEGCDRVVQACQRHGKSAGKHVVIPSAKAINGSIAQGFSFIALGIDTIFLAEGAKQALEIARSAREE